MSLLEQRDGRVSVDSVVAANHGLQPFQVNGPIDIDAPSPGVGGDSLLLATLDPTAGKHRMVLRTSHIHKIDGIILTLEIADMVVRFEELRLRFSGRPYQAPAGGFLYT